MKHYDWRQKTHGIFCLTPFNRDNVYYMVLLNEILKRHRDFHNITPYPKNYCNIMAEYNIYPKARKTFRDIDGVVAFIGNKMHLKLRGTPTQFCQFLKSQEFNRETKCVLLLIEEGGKVEPSEGKSYAQAISDFFFKPVLSPKNKIDEHRLVREFPPHIHDGTWNLNLHLPFGKEKTDIPEPKEQYTTRSWSGMLRSTGNMAFWVPILLGAHSKSK